MNSPFALRLVLPLAALLTPLATADDSPREGATAKTIPGDVKFEDGIVYKTAGGRQLDLLFFPPRKELEGAAPLVVFIHGGGWGKGNRYGLALRNMFPVIRRLLDEGVACASVEYRLADGTGPTVMDAVADCKDALGYFVREASRYKIDPARMGLFGPSAGGHLALVTGLGRRGDYPTDAAFDGPPPGIRAIVAFYPMVSFSDPAMWVGSNFSRPQRFLPLLGGPLEEKRKEAELLSPALLLGPDSPPLFLAHGDQDVVINVVNSRTLEKLAREKGVEVECVIVEGADHGFRGTSIQPSLEEVLRRAAEFLLRNLQSTDGPSGR